MDTLMNPAYLLRSYTWELMQQNELMSADDYDGLVPIVPLSEEPEISETDKPYMVYGYGIDNSGDLHARKRGSVTFAIYDQNFRRLTQIVNVLQAAFERQDEAARDVNLYTSTKTGYLGMRFGYIRLGFIEGGTPEDTEGGRQSALVNITFEYYVDYDVITDVR